MTMIIGSVSEIVGNTSLGHAWCWPRGFRAQSPRLSQSSGLEVHGTRAAMVSRQIKVTIKNDGWAITPFWVMEQKAEPITMGSPSEQITECINYEYLQSVCKNKYFITCTKVVYISTGMFVKMYRFWILSSPPPLAYSYWVVFSLNIQIDWQSERVFCEPFTKTKLACHLVFVFVCSSKLSRIWGSLMGTKPVAVIR